MGCVYWGQVMASQTGSPPYPLCPQDHMTFTVDWALQVHIQMGTAIADGHHTLTDGHHTLTDGHHIHRWALFAGGHHIPRWTLRLQMGTTYRWAQHLQMGTADRWVLHLQMGATLIGGHMSLFFCKTPFLPPLLFHTLSPSPSPMCANTRVHTRHNSQKDTFISQKMKRIKSVCSLKNIYCQISIF